MQPYFASYGSLCLRHGPTLLLGLCFPLLMTVASKVYAYLGALQGNVLVLQSNLARFGSLCLRLGPTLWLDLRFSNLMVVAFKSLFCSPNMMIVEIIPSKVRIPLPSAWPNPLTRLAQISISL